MVFDAFRIRLLATLCVAWLWANRAVAAPTYVADDVPARAGTAPCEVTDAPVDLVPITTPAAAPAAGTVVVGRFVTNLPTPVSGDDVTFRLDTHDTNRFPSKQIRIGTGGGAVDITDNHSPIPPADLIGTVVSEPPPGGYRVIEVELTWNPNYDFASLESRTWMIRACRHTSPAYYWGFYDAGARATVISNVNQPRLVAFAPNGNLDSFVKGFAFTDLPTTIPIGFGSAHISASSQYAVTEAFGFVNVGTAPFRIGSVSVTVTPSGATNPFAFDTISTPKDILPITDAFTNTLTFNPTTLGPAPAVSIQLNNTSGGTRTLNLSGTGVQLKSAALIDVSGSMLEDVRGSYPASSPQETKLWAARRAALEFAQLYGAISPQALLALYSYPNLAGTCPSSEQYIEYARAPKDDADPRFIPWANRLSPGFDASLLLTFNSTARGTPLAEGMKTTFQALTSHDEHQRVAVFMFGDGEHNCDSTGTIGRPLDWLNELRGRTVPYYTVPYGPAGSAWMQTFETIAEASGGRSFPANADASSEGFQKETKEALREIMQMEPVADPTTTIATGATKEHPICVTESTDQIVFSVHWKSHNPQSLNVTLRSPTSVAYTPASVGPTISYISGENYAAYVVRGALLRGTTGAGEWNLVVRANEGVTYTYQVFAKDRIVGKPGLTVAPGIFELGVNFFAEQTKFLGNLNVTAEYTAPSVSYETFLATTKVDFPQLQDLPKDIQGTLSWAEKKSYALPKTGEVKLVPKPIDPNAGTKAKAAPAAAAAEIHYAAQVDGFRIAGNYDAVVRVRADTAPKQCFQREYQISRFLIPLLTSILLDKNLVLTKLEPLKVFDGRLPLLDGELQEAIKKPVPAGTTRDVLQIEPKDESGNFFGIGRAREVEFNVQGAEKISGVQDGLDGSYYQVVQYKTGAEVKASVRVGGVAMTAPKVVIAPPPKPKGCTCELVGSPAEPAPFALVTALALAASVIARRRK
jgi:hypothetical protein